MRVYIPGAPCDGAWAGVCFLGGGGSKQPSSTTTTTKTEPWSGQKPYLTDIYGQAQTAYNNTNKDAYTGQLVAAPTTGQTQAVNNQLAMGQGLQGIGDSTMQLGQDTINGKYMDPSSNPYLQKTIDASLGQVLDKYKTQVLPGISSDAVAQGAYGGARHGLALAQSAQDVTQNMSDIAAKIGYENYANERGLQMQAPGLISTGVGLNDIGNQLLASAGGQQQTWNQNTLDELYQKYQMQQAAPWTGLSDYAGIIMNGSPGQTMTGTANMAGSNARTAGAISGAMGGAALGGLGAYGLMQAGAVNGWNPVGWGMMGAGALLGGLSGGL